MRLGQTDQDSFVVTLLTPVVPPRMPTLFEESEDGNAPLVRRMTRRLVEALARIVKPFQTLDNGVSWARTRPKATMPPAVLGFGQADAALLKIAACGFRERETEPDRYVRGFVRSLEREHEAVGGTIGLHAEIDGKQQTVITVLGQMDDEKAIRAHGSQAQVALRGDLKRAGRRWKLLYSRIESALGHDRLGSDHD